MSDPCDLSITRLYGVHDGDIVRIEAKDGPKVLARIDMPLMDFTKALMGGMVVTAAISMRGIL